MNFLAHLYLSGENIEIRLGNFIGDYVKGKKLEGYSDNIKKGIIIHRAIDTFTDQHPSTRACTKLLQPGYGKYSGVIVDIFYDHFLAKNWSKYSKVDLKSYSKTFYHQMVQKSNLLPASVRRFLPYMIHSDRLYSYRTIDGLKQAIDIMSSVSTLPANSEFGIQVLKDNYPFYNDHFHLFFDQIIDYIAQEYQIKIK